MLPYILHTQKVSTHCKEQNKKIIMTIGWKTKKLFKVKKCHKKLKIFSLKIHTSVGIFEKPQNFSK